MTQRAAIIAELEAILAEHDQQTCSDCGSDKVSLEIVERTIQYSDLGDIIHTTRLHTCGACGCQWTGKVSLIESELARPIHMRRPRRIAVGLMGDLFRLPDADIDRVFAVMALCPQHTFQVLTKQAERMSGYAIGMSGEEPWSDRVMAIRRATVDYEAFVGYPKDAITFPLPNVHFGVSAEDQSTLDARVPWLLRTPAAHRWLSLEPLLGPVDLGHVMWGNGQYNALTKGLDNDGNRLPHLDHVVVGGESGPGARPMHPDWVRQVRDACVAAGVRFTFKQWGEWAAPKDTYILGDAMDGKVHHWPYGGASTRVGKRAAGRLLDGRTWDGETK